MEEWGGYWFICLVNSRDGMQLISKLKEEEFTCHFCQSVAIHWTDSYDIVSSQLIKRRSLTTSIWISWSVSSHGSQCSSLCEDWAGRHLRPDRQVKLVLVEETFDSKLNYVILRTSRHLNGTLCINWLWSSKNWSVETCDGNWVDANNMKSSGANPTRLFLLDSS